MCSNEVKDFDDRLAPTQLDPMVHSNNARSIIGRDLNLNFNYQQQSPFVLSPVDGAPYHIRPRELPVFGSGIESGLSIRNRSIYTSADLPYSSSTNDWSNQNQKRDSLTSPTSPSGSSCPDDYSLKRAKNNAAVKKSRAKSKAKQRELEEKCEERRMENEKLKDRLLELERNLDVEKGKSQHLTQVMTMSHKKIARGSCASCSNL